VDAAQYFLQENQWEERLWRIDVISILRNPTTRETEITWFENALV
jgi:Holliday junction resolvase-like predicted endonuclease